MSIGSEMSGSVRDVRIQHNLFSSSQCVSFHVVVLCSSFFDIRYGFNVKTGRGRGGEVRDIVFAHNVVALSYAEVRLQCRCIQSASVFTLLATQVIRINMYYAAQPSPGPPETTPRFSNISIINVTGSTGFHAYC